MAPTKPKLLILDDIEGEIGNAPAMAQLKQMADVTILDRHHSLAELQPYADTEVILAIRERTTLSAAFFAQFPALRLILQTGGHAYHIDQAAAATHGVTVLLGRRVTQPMVVIPELTFGFMLALVRQIHPLTVRMKQGEWPQSLGGSLSGKTLGILGLGRHGRPISRIAQTFGMHVIAWDRQGKRWMDDGVERMPLDELLSQSDIVSIHLRLADETRNLFGKQQFEQMKPGALFINTARGAIVDEEALFDALNNGHLSGAGLDVFAHEPLAADSPLRTLPNILLTPHVGWQVDTVFHEFAQIGTEQLADWLNGTLNPDEILGANH